MLLKWISWSFIECFCICSHEGYWPAVFLSSGILFDFGVYQDNDRLIKKVWEWFYLLDFLEEQAKVVQHAQINQSDIPH